MHNAFYKLLKTCLLIFLISCQNEEPASKFTLNEPDIAYGNFTNNGAMLVTTDYLGNNNLWDLANHKLLYKLTDTEKTKDFADLYGSIMLADNAKMVFANSGHRLEIWDSASGRVINNYATSGIIKSFALNSTGNQALIGYNDRTVQLINTQTGNLIWKIKYNTDIERVNLSSDGLYALISLDTGVCDLWQVTQNKILHTFKNRQKIYFSAISPENRYVLIATLLEPVRLYELHSGELIYELIENRWLSAKLFKRNILQINAASFSRDLNTLITAVPNGRILVWELQTGTLIKEFQLPTDFFDEQAMPTILAVTYNQDYSFIYALTSNGLVYKWQHHK
jgi:WD40 repeat protein